MIDQAVSLVSISLLVSLTLEKSNLFVSVFFFFFFFFFFSLWIGLELVDFLPSFTRKTTSVTSCLLF